MVGIHAELASSQRLEDMIPIERATDLIVEISKSRYPSLLFTLTPSAP